MNFKFKIALVRVDSQRNRDPDTKSSPNSLFLKKLRGLPAASGDPFPLSMHPISIRCKSIGARLRQL